MEKNLDLDSVRKNYKIQWIMKISELILKSRQQFRSQRQNAFTEEVEKVTLSANDGKRMHSTDSIEIYAYGTSKDKRKKLNVTI